MVSFWEDPDVEAMFEVVDGVRRLRFQDLEGGDELLAEMFVAYDGDLDEQSTPPELREACLAGINAADRFTAAVPPGWVKLVVYRVSNVARSLWLVYRSEDAAPFLAWVAGEIAKQGWSAPALVEERGYCTELLATMPSGLSSEHLRLVAEDWYINVGMRRLLGHEPDPASVATFQSHQPLQPDLPRETAAPGSRQLGSTSFSDVFDVAYADLLGPNSPCAFGDIDSPVDRLGWYQSWEGWPPHPGLMAAMDWFEAASADHAYRVRGRQPVHARAGQLTQSFRDHATDAEAGAVYVRLGEPVFDEGALASVETFAALVVLASYARAGDHPRAAEWTAKVREMALRHPGIADDLGDDFAG